jgi:TPP-dependent pyruvate/acetoin dehydrogenase alpha subunit
MRGHAEHDDMKYVPKEQIEAWEKRDPIAAFEGQLLRTGALSQPELDGLMLGLERFVEQDLEAAEASPFPDPSTALPGVYGDREVQDPTPALVREWAARGRA